MMTSDHILPGKSSRLIEYCCYEVCELLPDPHRVLLCTSTFDGIARRYVTCVYKEVADMTIRNRFQCI